MSHDRLYMKLEEILDLPNETEWVEFKRNNANPEEIGEYLSAISNSAALHRKKNGYIIWGIEDGTHKVVGTKFRPRKEKIKKQNLEPWLLTLLNPRVDFSIYEFGDPGPRVVLFEIQPAQKIPVRFSGTEFIRIGESKKKLKDFPEKERKLWQILSEQKQDWSEIICKSATLDDLDSSAIQFARDQYKKKLEGDITKKHLIEELRCWDDRTFLNKTKVCINGQITTTAILLLGKPEAEHFLSPALGQITWILKDEHGMEKDYAHFGLPLILAVNQIFNKIRNLTYRYLLISVQK